MSTSVASTSSSPAGVVAFVTGWVQRTIAAFDRIPHSLIALLARFSVAMTFWLSGQTKVEGLLLDPINGMVQLGVPRLSDGALELFRSEYALPLIPPQLAATMAAIAEHVLPLLLLFGLASRFSALALLVMTMVIQLFVYPSAFPTHGLWAVSMLYIMARGPGVVSLDHWIAGSTGPRVR